MAIVSALGILPSMAAVLAPAITPSSGDSLAKFSVTITDGTPSSQIHYTLNGAEPTVSDPTVTSGGTVLIDRNLTLKANAWLGSEASETITSTFTLTGDVALGGSHSLAMTSSGSISAWGLRTNGRLGNNVLTANNISAPVESLYTATTSISDAIDVAGGLAHSVFLKSGGSVWAFGLNSTGQIGDNSTTARALATAVLKSTTTTDYLTGCTEVAAGDGFSLALSSSGQVYSWGSKVAGRLAEGSSSGTRLYAGLVTTVDSGNPNLSGINKIAAANGSAMAMATSVSGLTGGSGYVWVWGLNSSGQLGIGSTANSTRATLMKLDSTTTMTDVWDVSCGFTHTAVVRWKEGDSTLQGTVYCSGQQQYGRLGNNVTTSASKSYPVQAVKSDGTPLNGITSVAAGSAHTLALDINGNVWAWGYNGYGALGDGTGTNRGYAAKVQNPAGTGDLSGIVRIAAGGDGTENFSIAIASDGTVYAWGRNGNGQLGDGSTTNRTLPVIISSLDLLLPNPPTNSLAVSVDVANVSATLTASPADVDNNLSRVDFYSNGVYVGQATSAPWSLTMTGLAAGSYEVYAVAVDSTGLAGYSEKSTFGISTTAPTVGLSVSVTQPSHPGAATLVATPSDPENNVTKVAFYCNGSLLGQRTSAPWTYYMSNLQEGAYQVYAVATDATNLSGTSSLSTFTITYDPDSGNLDSDGDGISDTAETALGTSATDADTDGDGIMDGVDAQPTVADTIPLSSSTSTLLIWVPQN